LKVTEIEIDLVAAAIPGGGGGLDALLLLIAPKLLARRL
jgi:hypothetical protein